MNTSLVPVSSNEKPAVITRAEEKAIEKIHRDLSNTLIELSRPLLTPQKILKVGRVTVVFWNDSTSTAVRCGENEISDDYTAFCAALGKKIFGCNSALKRAFMDAPTETRDV